LCSVHGLYSRAATGTVSYLVSDGKGRHKSQLAAKQRVQQLRVHELRGQLSYE
jgi:hypothetical protein